MIQILTNEIDALKTRVARLENLIESIGYPCQNSERLAQNLVNCMGHVSGEHKHWKEGYNTIAAYEKLKGESK